MSTATHPQPYTMQGVRMPNGDLNRMKTAKQAVADYLNEADLLPGDWAQPSDIYVVWFCKTLQNWKALLSTDLTDSGIYFEVTYDGDKQSLYLDHYSKVENRPIAVV